MATDWKTLTPEQKAEINAKRRAKYSSLESEAKSSIRERAKLRYIPVCRPQTYSLRNEDGSTRTIDNPEMVEWLYQIDLRIKRRKSRFQNRIDRIQAWVKAGGLYPWPSLQDKMDLTRTWHQIATILGRKCCQCGTTKVFDFSWRLTRKDDFLAFVPFKKEAYDRVLRAPNEYCLYCIHCTFDLRIFTFAWIFSPYSPRNNPALEPCHIAGPKYADWNSGRWREMYPHDAELIQRIRQGRIKSLTCGIRKGGKFINTFIRKNQYYGWAGLQPRDLAWETMEEIRSEESRRNPSIDTSFWAIGHLENKKRKVIPY